MDKRTSAWYLNEASETAIVKFSIIRCMFIIQRLIRIRAQRHQHILALNKHQHKQNWKHRLQILFNVINILLHLFNVFYQKSRSMRKISKESMNNRHICSIHIYYVHCKYKYFILVTTFKWGNYERKWHYIWSP